MIRPEAVKVLSAAAAKIQPVTTVALTGFADPRGDANANLEMSRRRATAVAQAHKAMGVTATLTIQARGVDKGSDLQKARRVEIDLP